MANRENHTTTWTADELDLLTAEWGRSPLEEVAEVLGRTVEACRQRYYEWTWGRTEAAATKAVAEGRTYHAAAASHRYHRTAPDRPLVVCQSCWTAKAANGTCLC